MKRVRKKVNITFRVLLFFSSKDNGFQLSVRFPFEEFPQVRCRKRISSRISLFSAGVAPGVEGAPFSASGR